MVHSVAAHGQSLAVNIHSFSDKARARYTALRQPPNPPIRQIVSRRFGTTLPPSCRLVFAAPQIRRSISAGLREPSQKFSWSPCSDSRQPVMNPLARGSIPKVACYLHRLFHPDKSFQPHQSRRTEQLLKIADAQCRNEWRHPIERRNRIRPMKRRGSRRAS